MKTFYALLMAMTMLIGSNAFAFIGSPISNSYDAAGSVSHYDKVWLKVYNGTGSSVARGYMVVPDTSSDDGIVFALPTASVETEHPLCMLDEVCADGAMCKCLRYGYTDQLRYDGATTAVAMGNIYLGSATAGMVQYEASGDIAIYQDKIGIFFDADSSLGQVEALIDL